MWTFVERIKMRFCQKHPCNPQSFMQSMTTNFLLKVTYLTDAFINSDVQRLQSLHSCVFVVLRCQTHYFGLASIPELQKPNIYLIINIHFFMHYALGKRYMSYLSLGTDILGWVRHLLLSLKSLLTIRCALPSSCWVLVSNSWKRCWTPGSVFQTYCTADVFRA